MKRILGGLGAVVLLGVAVAWSQSKPARPELDFALDKINPVTHLRLNNNPDEFQFAIVSDRTGGNRGKVFSRAVEQLNLLQPEFVLSVGDLIEGYTTDKVRIEREWREFQSYTSRLQMPFFYVPGNHDLTNQSMVEVWKDRFGRSNYEFLYRGVLFLILDSENAPRHDQGFLAPDQIAWLKKVLAKYPSPRWTLVFLHKPMWIMPNLDSNGWLEAEKALAGRKYTVFAGHVHRYQKFVRQGQNYYMLGTTGGVSKLRGPEFGEVDHIVWVTMKKDGPLVANLLLEGIVPMDLSPIYSDEPGVKEYYRRPTHPASVIVTYKGKPVENAFVVFQGIGTEPRQPRADGYTDAIGKAVMSTYEAWDGIPLGEYSVLIERRVPRFTLDGKRGPNQLPAKYADAKITPLRALIKAGTNEFRFDLAD